MKRTVKHVRFFVYESKRQITQLSSIVVYGETRHVYVKIYTFWNQ